MEQNSKKNKSHWIHKTRRKKSAYINGTVYYSERIQNLVLERGILSWQLNYSRDNNNYDIFIG